MQFVCHSYVTEKKPLAHHSLMWLSATASDLRTLNFYSGPGARFSKVPVTFRARNQIFKSKYKE